MLRHGSGALSWRGKHFSQLFQRSDGQTVDKVHHLRGELRCYHERVIIVKTAIPHSTMHGETESPFWGLTTLPGNPELTLSGSSGGEAALMAMSGPLGG